MHALRLFLLVPLVMTSPALAQVDAGLDANADAARDPQAEAFDRAIDADPFTSEDPAADPSDPLARGDGAALASVVPDPDIEEAQAPVPVRHGEVIEAISGVREQSHAMAITLEGGLAITTETMVFASSARHRAEVMMRLAVPESAVLVSLHVENAAGARDGTLADASAPQSAYDDALIVRSTTPTLLPVAHARHVRDARGSAFVVRAAPVGTGAPSGEEVGALTVTLVWLAPTPMHGGTARLAMPARGSDERAAAADVSLTAVDLVEPRIDGSPYEHGAFSIAARSSFVVTALAPLSRGPRVEGALVPCGSGSCAVLRAIGGRAHVSSAPVVIAIDASPSTTIGARGRIADTVRVLSALLPRATPVRVIAFAARTEDLGSGSPGEVDLARVRVAVEAPLGSATRFSALWAAIESGAHSGDRVILVGDGGVTSGVLEESAFASARARGVIVSAIDVADRPATQPLALAVRSTGGVVIEAGAAADRAAAGHGDDALGELLSAALADPVADVALQIDGHAIALGTLRTGEELTWIGAATRAEIAMGGQHLTTRAADAAHAVTRIAYASRPLALIAVDRADLDAAAGACAADGSARARPTSRASSIVGHGLRVAPAHRRSCQAPSPAVAAPPRVASLPARVLRDQLRRRVVPPARACFRDDRAGRSSHHREVAFDLTLADREIVSVGVVGDLPDTLRACLLGAFDGVEVPSFDGTLVVRWPVHTEAVLPPPLIEFAPDVAREVGEIAGDEPIPTAP